MSINDTLIKGFTSLVDKTGQNCIMQYFLRVNTDNGSIWDDVTSLTEVAGSKIGLSGIVLPINGLNGTQEFLLQEQGLLANGDLKLYVSGGANFGQSSTGSDLQVIVQLGSPKGDKYTVVNPGVTAPEVNGNTIYQKVYLRKLVTGSLYGE